MMKERRNMISVTGKVFNFKIIERYDEIIFNSCKLRRRNLSRTKYGLGRK